MKDYAGLYVIYNLVYTDIYVGVDTIKFVLDNDGDDAVTDHNDNDDVGGGDLRY